MIFVRGARQLVTLRGPSPPRRGDQLSDLGIIPDGAILIDGERIREVGTTRRIENLAAARSARVIDASGKIVLPGFVDSSVRLIAADAMPHPFAPRQPGLLEAAAAFPRAAGSGAKILRARARARLDLFASHGTTTVEARSGHGLRLPAELKALRATRALDGSPLDVACAFSAGRSHGLNPEPPAADVEQVTEVLLPILRRRKLTSICAVECGPGNFHTADARRIIEAAAAKGFRVRLEGEMHAHSGLASLAVESGVSTVEHLEHIAEREMGPLANSATIATLLPAFAHAGCNGRYAPARQMVDHGVAIALASGFNAGSPTLSIPMVLSLACREMKLTPAESIAAATINGAAAMGRAQSIGSIEPGKQADLAIFDVQDYREIPYYFGFNLCVMTIKKGRVIYRAPFWEQD